jgi:PncC family amidohydrolase
MEGNIADQMHERRATLAVMESCTGGLLASTLTDVPGSSCYFLGGYVTYATQQKVDLGVSAELLQDYGVVSPEVAKAMAEAARSRAGADYGIGITGVAGPDPEEGIPPGTVHVAVATPEGGAHSLSMTMNQGRQAVKRRAVTTALLLLRRALLGEAR